MTITMRTAQSPTFPSLHLRHSSFFNPSVALPTSQIIFQHFRWFTYVTSHYPTLLSLFLRHRLIFQPFHHFTYFTAHSSTLPSLYLRHSSFSNFSLLYLCHGSFSSPSFTFPIRHRLILQPFRHFTYVTAHSPNLSWLYLRHSSFSNPSVALPTSQLILQPFFHFSYVRG